MFIAAPRLAAPQPFWGGLAGCVARLVSMPLWTSYLMSVNRRARLEEEEQQSDFAAPPQPSWGGVAGREVAAAVLGRGNR